MKTLPPALFALLACSTQVAAQTPRPPIIELRLAVVSPTPGHERRELVDSTFYVSNSVLFADGDIRRADTTWSEGVLHLHVRLTPQAAERLAEATRDHVGDRVAVFFNGEFTAAIPIVSPVSGRALRLEAFGPPKADGLAAQVLARWPPRN
jgi:preprotein translocase subunit SecD